MNDPGTGKSRAKKETRSKHSVRKSGRSSTKGFNWGEVDDEVQPEVFIPVKKKKRGKKSNLSDHLPSTLSAVHSDYTNTSTTEKKRSMRSSAPPKRVHTEEDDLLLPSYGRPLLDSDEDDDFIRNLLRTAEEPDSEPVDAPSKAKKRKPGKRNEKSDRIKNSSQNPVPQKSSEPVEEKIEKSEVRKDPARPSDRKKIKRPVQQNAARSDRKGQKCPVSKLDQKDPKLSEQKDQNDLSLSDKSKPASDQCKPADNRTKDPQEISLRQLRSLREMVARKLRRSGVKKDRINSLLNMEIVSPSMILFKMIEILLEIIPEVSVSDSSDQAPKIMEGSEKDLQAADPRQFPQQAADRRDPDPGIPSVPSEHAGPEKRKEKKTHPIREEIKIERTDSSVPVPDPGKESREKKTRQIPVRSPSKEKENLSKESPRKDRSDREEIKDVPGSGFSDLSLSAEMLTSLHEAGYEDPTPVQKGTIGRILTGVDLIGQAKTGTGKTAAFLIPIIEKVDSCPPGNDPVALIVVPTRELAVQVRDEAVKLTAHRDLDIVACYGGKPIFGQIKKLNEGADIVVGTPGRIIDLVSRRALSLAQLHWVVLDEADRMLDIGFRPDIEKILRQTPKTRQTLLFSATLPDPVVYIAKKYMQEPEHYDFSANDISSETIEQYYISVDRERKYAALIKLLELEKPAQAIVFCRTKRAVDKIGHHLERVFDNVGAIHGDLSQDSRDNIMKKFRDGTIRILVATDVVGRGIDVSGISHIINYDIPQFCDDYVHRVGRTGRMGREGVAFSLVTVEEGIELTRIEKRINRLLKRTELPDFQAYMNPGALKTEEPQEVHKPVFGKSRRLVRRAL